MKTLIIAACLFLSACTLPQVIYVDRPANSDAFWLMHQNSVRASQPQNLVDPLPQHGSSMGFMCRDAVNRGDQGGAFIFC
jgi:hypothetical protein